MAELPPFQKLIDEHATEVMAVLRGAVGRDGAEDAFQETFLAALRAYPGLRDADNLRGWLVTIAHRKAIDVTRRRERHAVPVERLPEEQSTLGLPDESATGIWAAVGQLPVKQRQAVAYHYLGGLPYREVAAILGGSTDAARRAAADGIRSLRARWDRAATGQPR